MRNITVELVVSVSVWQTEKIPVYYTVAQIVEYLLCQGVHTIETDIVRPSARET